MKTIAACAYSTGASALKRLSDWVARLYEQGASKKRIARYLVRWLGWAAMASAQSGGQAETRLNDPGFCQASPGSPIMFVANTLDVSIANHTFSVNFPSGTCGIYIRGLPQIISLSTATGGTVICSPSSPEYGTSATCTASPVLGFTTGTWGNDCGTGSAANACTLSNVTSAKPSPPPLQPSPATSPPAPSAPSSTTRPARRRCTPHSTAAGCGRKSAQATGPPPPPSRPT